jgi:hypothetical protein
MTLHTSALGQEWNTLQNNYESYERSALQVKLLAVVLCMGGYALGLPFEVTAGFIVLLWVQECVLRTGQARLGERMVRLEALVRNDAAATSACQLHTEWLATRGSGNGNAGLLAEYARHALRPTVAFPYAVLVLAEVVAYLG